jgi:hypothetical protein
MSGFGLGSNVDGITEELWVNTTKVVAATASNWNSRG